MFDSSRPYRTIRSRLRSKTSEARSPQISVSPVYPDDSRHYTDTLFDRGMCQGVRSEDRFSCASKTGLARFSLT